jgi:hypothetical protein
VAWADEPRGLLAHRASAALDSMERGLTDVTVPRTPEPLVAEAVGPSVPPPYTSDGADPNCYTLIEANCGEDWTQSIACLGGTYPPACNTQQANWVTCEPNLCSLKTAVPIGTKNCTSTPGGYGCDYTAAANCDAFTHRRYSCRTDTQFCENATMAEDCPTSEPGENCSNTDTYNVSCLTTYGGGDCTIAGACLTTYGKNCITSSAGMCPIEPVEPPAGGSPVLYASVALLGVLGCFRKLGVAC